MSNRLGGLQGTAYLGTNANQPPNMTFSTRDPNQNDTNASLGDMWLNQTTQSVFMLVSLAGNATSKGALANWVALESGGGSPANSFVTDDGIAAPVAGVLNVIGGMGIETSGAGNTLTVASTGVFYQYVDVTLADSPYTVQAFDTYISVDTSAGAVTLLFPDVAALGEPYVVKDRTGNGATNPIVVRTPGLVTTFDGSATVTMDTNFQSLSIVGNGTNYELY